MFFKRRYLISDQICTALRKNKTSFVFDMCTYNFDESYQFEKVLISSSIIILIDLKGG